MNSEGFDRSEITANSDESNRCFAVREPVHAVMRMQDFRMLRDLNHKKNDVVFKNIMNALG